MGEQGPATLGRYARDVYSFAHFPLIFGVIGFAVGIELSIAHPKDPLGLTGILALSLGVGLILGATALALALARVRVPPVRWWLILILIGAIPLLESVPAWVAVTAVSALVVAMNVIESGPTPLARRGLL